MKPLRKTLLKALSRVNVDIKKNYKIIRQVQKVTSPPVAKDCDTFDDIILGQDLREIPVRWFIPINLEHSGLILFFHGGGWVSGTVDSYTRVCAQLATATGRKVLSVDYRLAPEFPFPHGLLDCYDVAHHLFIHAHEYGINLEEMILMGDSAGGNLVAALSLLGRDLKTFTYKKQILCYPVTYFYHGPGTPFESVMENGEDYLLTMEKIHDYMDLYVSDIEDRLTPYVSPLLSKSHENLPDTMVITAELDLLRDEGEAYGLLLRRAQNQVKIYRINNALHGFLTHAIAEEERETAWMLINGFLNNEPM